MKYTVRNSDNGDGIDVIIDGIEVWISEATLKALGFHVGAKELNLFTEIDSDVY